jgi:hypothetical protein
MKVYDYLISKCTLSIPHRIDLQTNRGFTDETIALNRFVSGGVHLSDLLPELVANFTEVELLDSKVAYKEGATWKIARQLLEDRVIIPYISKDGSIYSIRPHKFGLKDLPVAYYQEANMGPQIILTEGEFKATAARQMGFYAIAIPGIGSFSDSHFPSLVAALQTHSVKDICIIFDNEVKDDPQFKDRYKEEPAKRYDTHFYAWLMCKMLVREGFNCRIGWLPDEWRQNGKADIDGALAQGKTTAELSTVVQTSTDFKEFFYAQPPEIQRIIKRKDAKRYLRSHVKKNFGHYVATRYEGGEAVGEETISNFTVKIISTHETPDGIMREVRFTNEFGESTPAFTMSPQDMASAEGFTTFCLSKGNYIWRGQKKDLQNIWEEEFLDDDGKHIIEPDHIGWVKSEGIFIFGNVAFKEGKEITPDANGVFWTDKKGIKPLALGISSGRTEISEGIPSLKKDVFEVEQARAKFSESIGDMNARMALGWVTAVMFLEEVFAQYNCFPFLFVTGKRRSGKSTIAEWLMNFYGLEGSGKGASDTTQVGLQRYLAYYSSLPLFVDEYRNTRQVTPKNGFLRNAYNRQSAGKGIKSDFGVREARVRGTLLIAGEETPEDNALLTRCVVLNITERQRTANHYTWFMANRHKFSYHTYNILKNKQRLLPQFMKVLKEAKDVFVENGADDRTAINYAIVAAGYSVAFGEQDIDFADWIITEAARVREEYDSEQATTVFFEDILALKSNNAFKQDLWAADQHKIYIYFKGLYNLWSEDFRRRRGNEPFKDSAIRDYLKEEPGFLELNKTHRISGQPCKCIVFDRDKCNELLRFLVES